MKKAEKIETNKNRRSKSKKSDLKNKENENKNKDESDNKESIIFKDNSKLEQTIKSKNYSNSQNLKNKNVKLHKICLENFKSFEGKHDIGYFQNFSVVLGPNGSGKSNIIDAICFALGMKTMSLRSKNLKELIFKKDSENSQNLSEEIDDNKKLEKNKYIQNNQLNSANVELIFHTNYDFSTQSISLSNQIIKFKRTITSKGTSDYFVDDKKLSYEEYIEKLEKLNIPSKTRYFILVQGAIDSLLSKKNDLTETIEYLSGSYQFKEEYENLKNSIESLTNEINKNSSEVNNIRLDKNKIKTQIQNEEKFNELIISLNNNLEKIFLYRIAEQEMLTNYNINLIEQNEESLKLIQEEKKKNLELLRTKDLMIKNLESSFKIDDREGEELKKKLDESSSNLLNCLEKIKLYDAQILGKTSMINQQKMEIKNNQEKKNVLKNQITNMEKEMSILKQKIEFEDPTEILPKIQIETYHKISNSYELEVFPLIKQIQEIKKETSENKNKIFLYEKNKNILENEKQNLEKELRVNKENEITEITNRASLEDQIRILKNDIKEKSKEICENKNNFELCKNSYEENQKKLSSFEYNMSENSKRKKISELIKNNPKVYGFLFELVSPIKKQFELPVKVSLLKYLNYLIVEDNETAKICSEFLKSKEISSDVIVLENIPEKSFDENLRNKLGNMGTLIIDLIDCKRKGIKEAIKYLIKDIVLCHDPNANNLNTIKQKGFTNIITTEGTIYKKGTITAGNYRYLEQIAFNYITNNQEELSKTKQESDQLILKMKSLEEKTTNMDEFNKIKINLSENENLSESSNRNLKMITENISKIKIEIKEKENNLNNLVKLIEEIKDLLLKKRMDLNNLENQKELIKSKYFGEFMRKYNLDDLKVFENYSLEEIKRLSEESKVLEEKCLKLKINLKNYESQDEIFTKLEKSLIENKDKKKNLEFEKENIEIINKENLEYFENYKLAKSSEYQKLSLIKEEISQLQNDLDRIDKRIRGLLKNKIDFEHVINNCIENKKNILQESKLNLENYISEMGVNLTSIFIPFNSNLESHYINTNILFDKQNILFNFEKIQKKFNMNDKNNFDFEFISGKIEKLKVKFCDKINEVDKYVKIITLIDSEYDKLKDKEDELGNKKKNFNLLIQSLITESDQKKKEFEDIKMKRKKLFDEFFSKLSIKLSETYKDLTKPIDSNLPGGSVYIYKTNNEEPYIGSVCYLPTPPGKRSIHDIDLLSGGEKTIAILCLLISIQSICLTPLLILDEIDCYLDPQHELVLENLFKRKNQDFQIIIVTHKSNIFRSAHSLLGTYFNKKKNSSIHISLDLLSLKTEN